jgi:TetR/AcrR family transcriptional regulator, acrAB operon repressor
VRRVFEIATHNFECVAKVQAVRDRNLASRNECLAHVERSLGLAMKRGELSGRQPARAAALGLHALIDGLIQNWMLDPSAFNLVRVGNRCSMLIWRGWRRPKRAKNAASAGA